eukprot:TRINITY_DN4090_c0_g1_i3.p1 TRINITY_DN4090_c0_g1~~TRINITY_DN4090_c0_g1_i3.p1  ORF type:complete len:480 (-),score=186.28 TRINITY_DN4090_c0_g1_i3:1341-2780(-)
MASPPTYDQLSLIYPAGDTDAVAQRFASLEARFVELYGGKPEFYVRAPGRVNLIGEHIDYSGYGVLPMAIELDTVVAVRRLSHVESGSGAAQLRIGNTRRDEFAPHTADNADGDVVIDSQRHGWHNYFLAGYKGVMEQLRPATPLSLQCVVDGLVPMGSGLSSSSALVCAAALATAAAYEPHPPLLSKVDIATLCARSERYIGTQGGGMDQAISFLAQPGKAQLIEFDPLRPSDVVLPPGAVFVIANSLVQANKYYSAFNLRVVECRLAALVLAARLGVPLDGVRRLGHVHALSGRSLADMLAAARELLHPAPYSLDEVAAAIGSDVETVRTTYVGSVGGASFDLHRRAVHVFAEAQRVYTFRDVCAQATSDGLQRLGELMNDSHASCSQLYECSCPELDQLTSICRAAGALGSRLTGAGWGGCTISLVPEAKLEGFLEAVRRDYYAAGPLRLDAAAVDAQHALFVSRPGNGAAIYRPA